MYESKHIYILMMKYACVSESDTWLTSIKPPERWDYSHQAFKKMRKQNVKSDSSH